MQLPKDVLTALEGKSFASSLDLDLWLFQEGWKESPAVRRYVYFLASMRSQFALVAKYFPTENLGREKHKDSHGVATTPEEMFAIARHLYVLDSYGVEGDLFEAGCFKGFSTCCLSLACRALGRRMVVADSFEGLPASDEANTAGVPYDAADFRGSFDEVKRNVSRWGALEVVDFVKGWYDQTLTQWDKKIALLWMDVDLHVSAVSLLNGVLPQLDPQGLIFSHEFLPFMIQNQQISYDRVSVPLALQEAFSGRGIRYKTWHVASCTAILLPSGSAVKSYDPDREARLFGISLHQGERRGMKSALKSFVKEIAPGFFEKIKATGKRSVPA